MSAAPQLIERKAGSWPPLAALLAALGLSLADVQHSSAGPAAALKPAADIAGATEKAAPGSRKPQRHPPPAEIEEIAGLPRILLIGDHGWGPRSGANSAGYTLAVRELLRDKANVQRVAETGLHTDKAVASLDKWLGNRPWDVIHFNFGLHDLKRRDNGEPQVPLAGYEKNLRLIVARLKQTGAALIWASTTPILPGSSRCAPEDAVRYNAVARKVMDDNSVVVNDIYAAALPHLAVWLAPRSVHFTEEGASAVAKHVSAAIAAALTTRTRSQQQ